MPPKPLTADQYATITEGGVLTHKLDANGRMYREVRCPECRAWLADEYIRKGRLILKCFRCGKVITMEFKSRHATKNKVEPEKSNKGENLNGK